MRILLSGASGLVGTAVTRSLKEQGHDVLPLSRSAAPGRLSWNPPYSAPPLDELEGLDAVIHLAGESIAAGRWTSERKRRIRESRVQGTRLLSEALAKLQRPPAIFLTASAIGYYGDRGDELLTEQSAPGKSFLASVCQEWENATAPAAAHGIRSVHLRFGIILSRQGGALTKMLLPFQLGVGGVVGSGRQWMSWVSLDDVASAISFLLKAPLSGPVNVVSPQPVTNREFTKTLGVALHRPTLFPLPAFAARWALGEMADELLLASTRVLPEALEKAGYRFRYPALRSAFEAALHR